MSMYVLSLLTLYCGKADGLLLALQNSESTNQRYASGWPFRSTLAPAMKRILKIFQTHCPSSVKPPYRTVSC